MFRSCPTAGVEASRSIPRSAVTTGFPRVSAGWDYRTLCRRLATDDDAPELLSMARAALETRLAKLVKRDSKRPATPAGPGSSAGVDDLRYLLPWLAGAGAELCRIAQAATGHRQAHALLFGIYVRCFAPGSPSDQLRAAAQAADDSQPATAGGVVDSASELLHEAVFLRLGLGCFPVAFFPEILGYALAELRSAAPQCEGLRDVTREHAGVLEILQTQVRCLQGERPVLAAAWKAARRSATGQTRSLLNARMVRGIALYQSLTEQAWQALEAHRHDAVDVIGAMRRLLLSKAPFATGYHGGVMIGGRSLDAWFADQPFQTDALLSALAASAWIDREVPERSHLLSLFRFGGPMFGVLTADEEATLRAWLAGLRRPVSDPTYKIPMAVESGDRAAAGGGGAPQVVAEVGVGALVRRDARRLRTVPRGLFHALVNPEEQQPGAFCSARRYIERCLQRVARDLWHRCDRFPYSEATFETWLNALYRRQTDSASPKPRSVPKLPRGAYVFGIEQLAPAVLVDGCWLQRVDGLARVSPGVARRLTTIYADELGSGNVVQNHPWIYRRLLVSLGIDCPAVDSIDFPSSPRFLDAAFELPALLLSISVHTHRFLPELLGLNLAIEVSGLGASYGRVARDLEYWGIDAQIVRLHQSIDNLASGHAALARDTIVVHLRQVRGLGGEAAEQEHWQRIQRGYDLLRVVTRPFKWRLAAAYLTRGWVPRLRTRVMGPQPT
ncbi:iron-containing redox enzyme family protein [Methylolobus aquaticus]|nr:iron-containing redox enzyme family protein [Methylolobus aquaticus]